MNAPFVAGALFALFSAWMLRHAIRSHRTALASRSWPSTEGKLTRVRLWGRRNVDGEMKEVEKLDLEYAYTVDGRELRGNNPTFHTLVYPETAEFAARHPEGSTVEVHYDPADPPRSVLVPGPREGNKRYSDILLGAAGLLASLVLCTLGALGKLG